MVTVTSPLSGSDEDGCECRQHKPAAAAARPILLPTSLPPGGEEVVSVTGCVHTLRHLSRVTEEVVSVTGCVHTLRHLSRVSEEVVSVTGCVHTVSPVTCQ